MKNLFKPELTAIATGVAQSAKMIEKMADTSAKILDYGCGLGRNINYLKNNGFDVEGCDTPTQVARIKDKVDFKVTTSETLKNNRMEYDYILCSHVLNVVEDDVKKYILEDIILLLKDNGKAVIQVRTANDVEKAKNKIPHGDGWLIKKGTDFTYQEGISKEKMVDLVETIGFEVIDHKFNKSVHIITLKKSEVYNMVFGENGILDNLIP